MSPSALVPKPAGLRIPDDGKQVSTDSVPGRFHQAKNRIGALEEGDLRPENVERIATDLNVTEDEVVSMNRRMGGGGDASLNAPLGGADGEGASEWQDWLADDDADQAQAYAEQDEMEGRRALLIEAMQGLNERERHILTERRLKDNGKPTTAVCTSTLELGIDIGFCEIACQQKLWMTDAGLTVKSRLKP